MSKEQIIKFITPAILLLFFISTLWLVFGVHSLVNSPDESANLQFALSFKNDGDLKIYEPMNNIVGGILHPRSMLAREDYIVPRSFLGLPVVYGILARFLGEVSLMLITPVLAVLALLAFKSIIKTIFKDENLANLSALMLMLHPAFWYYSARTMMHNVPFVSLLIFGVYFFVKTPIKKRAWLNDLLAGFFIALALAFRTSEIIWILASSLLLIPLIYNKTIGWQRVAVFSLSALLVLAIFGIQNTQTYGSFFETGYTTETSVTGAVASYEGVIDAPIVVEQNVFSGLLGYLFPFGIHELAILRHIFGYGFLLYPWMVLPAIASSILIIKQWRTESKAWRLLLLYTLALSAWLGVVYGSWTFFDNPDQNIVTIGNSYVRYWLPLFVLSTPFVARTILFLNSKLQARFEYKPMLLIILVMTALSVKLVFFSPDGLIHTRKALQTFAEKRSVIVENTEEDAIIIVDRADKFVFPARTVVTPLRSEATFAELNNLVEKRPLYYWGITLPEKDVVFLNSFQLSELGLQIEYRQTVLDESLYKITLK